MSEIAAIAQALASLKAASELVKGLRGVDGKIREADLKITIADLTEALADARLSIVDAKEQIEVLEARVRTLEAQPQVRANLERRDNVYYLKNSTGDRDEGPYCVGCYETSDKLIPLSEQPAVFRNMGRFRCPVCQTIY